MARNATRTAEAADAANDAQLALLDGGTIEIYTTPQPADPTVAITTQTLLAVLTFGTPAFGASAAGIGTANAITPDAAANASGTPAWARLKKSGGTALMDCTAGTISTDLILDHATINVNDIVSATSLTIREKLAP